MTDRYARQAVLPEIGPTGQARLAAASVLVVGAGGLGCPVLQYLAGAGVGRLTIVDHDTVEETNLHRQPLYGMPDIGKLKAEAARATLQRFNPHVRIDAVAERLTPQNAARLVAEADIVVDAADSFAVTYMLSDVCFAMARPLVSASVIGMTGYAGVFCGGGPSYRAVFPEVSVDGGTCATVGVIGTAVAMMGSLRPISRCIICSASNPACWAASSRSTPSAWPSAASLLPEVPSPRSRCLSSHPTRCEPTTSWSTCAVSTRRRSRPSPARGGWSSIRSANWARLTDVSCWPAAAASGR